MVAIDQMRFAYPGQAPVFDGFSLEIPAGGAWSVIGPSGGGKTTLLYLLAGLLKPSAGQITVGGKPLDRPRPRTALVLQDHGLLPWATVADNTRLGLRIRRFYGADGRHAPADEAIDPQTAEQAVQFWLQRLAIDHLADKYPGQLSRGQRQRAAIARSLVLSPDLLLLDEPFSALDARTRQDLHAIMDELHHGRVLTRILVTHDIEEAVRMGSMILALCGQANAGAVVVPNTGAGERPAERGSPRFCDQCQRLRRILGAEQ
jgi:NitT/TauT family transport system ATP-binding protein